MSMCGTIINNTSTTTNSSSTIITTTTTSTSINALPVYVELPPCCRNEPISVLLHVYSFNVNIRSIVYKRHPNLGSD